MYQEDQDRVETLKMKLKSVVKLKLCKAREELTLRNTERMLLEELRTTKIDIEMMSQQFEDIKQDVSKMKYQIAMIGICEASDKSKIESHITNIEKHQNDFDNLFAKENEAMEMHHLEIKKREEQRKETEQQKENIIEEKNQRLQQDAQATEDECEAIEQECAVLMKRNKAIMLKLRRKLIESEDMRRALMRSGESPKSQHQD